MVRELDVDNANPATIERLVARAAEPIPADGADEVGKVAGAFNPITAPAVRIGVLQAHRPSTRQCQRLLVDKGLTTRNMIRPGGA